MSPDSQTTFDLPGYLARIGFTGAIEPDVDALRALHLAHVTAIPFENLDIQMGQPILLDLESLQQKLVRQRRGGYCFEQNTLFQHVLLAVGFEVTACEARVRSRGSDITPRTHMVLVVRIDGEDLIADVGFGSDGPIQPVEMDRGSHTQFDRTYRLEEEGEARVLQLHERNGWSDLYAFMPQARYPVDFEVANWFTSTFPESGFVKTLTAQRILPDSSHVLRNLSYTVTRDGAAATRDLDRSELVPLLRSAFGIEVAEDARFSSLDD